MSSCADHPTSPCVYIELISKAHQINVATKVQPHHDLRFEVIDRALARIRNGTSQGTEGRADAAIVLANLAVITAS